MEDNTHAQPIEGLIIEDTLVGEGQTVQSKDNIVIHYTGYLQNPDGSLGTKFDSSVDRNEPFDVQIGVGYVIQGWDKGVIGMKVGGKRRLIISPELGYGSRGAGAAIPPNATLIFDLELLAIE